MKESRMDVENVKAVSTSPKADAAAPKRADADLRSPEEIHQVIAVIAYRMAESRNFEPGHEIEDWLNAEREVLAESEGLKGFPA